MPKNSELDNYHHFPHQNGTPLQIVRWTGRRVALASDASSTAMALPVAASLIEISATENCYMTFGDAGAVASASIAVDGPRLFLSGVQIVPVPLDGSGDPYTHLAVIQQGTAGIVQVEEVI